MPRNDLMNAMRARMGGPKMRDESLFDSITRLAATNPRVWVELQKATNDHNNETGDRATIRDVLTDGRRPVHMSGREDMMLGDVPDMPMKGRHGDDRMGMVTPRQEMLLKQHGGSGTRHPKTGMREYFGDDGGGDFGSMSAEDTGGWDGAADAGGGDFGSMSEADTGGWDGGFASTSFDGVTEGDLNMNPEGTRPGEAWGFGGSGGAGETAVWSPNDPTPRRTNVWGDLDDLRDEALAPGPSKTGSGADPNASSTMGLGKSARAGLQSFNKTASDALKEHFDDKTTMAFASSPLAWPVLSLVESVPDKYRDPAADEAFFSNVSMGTGTDDPMLQSGGTSTQTAAAPAPGFMSSALPQSWRDFYGSDFDSMSQDQLRTGAATQAMFGPGAVFTTPESTDYWRRLASESINPLNPPEDVDLQFLERILGRQRPTGGTAEAFLEALRY